MNYEAYFLHLSPKAPFDFMDEGRRINGVSRKMFVWSEGQEPVKVQLTDDAAYDAVVALRLQPLERVRVHHEVKQGRNGAIKLGNVHRVDRIKDQSNKAA